MDWGWKRSFKLESPKTEILGLDIGSSTVKMVQLRKTDTGCTVTAAGIVDIAASENNNNRKDINTVRAIDECLESIGTGAKLAVCSVCGPEVAVRAFRFPSLPAEELQGAILLEASQVCPFNIDDGAVDYQLTSGDEIHINGVLVAATNRLIKKRRQLAKNASLKCVLLDVDGLALLNCFSECGAKQAGQTTTILNVGSSYTNLAIVGDNALPFIRDIAHAGQTIVNTIAMEKGVSTETVSRKLCGCEDPTEPHLELYDSLGRACQELVVDVAETLRYYMAQEKSAVIQEIFVCGGFALVKGFVELLDSQLPVSVVLWNPFDEIGCSASKDCKDILAKKGPALAVAAGLALRSIGSISRQAG